MARGPQMAPRAAQQRGGQMLFSLSPVRHLGETEINIFCLFSPVCSRFLLIFLAQIWSGIGILLQCNIPAADSIRQNVT